MKFAGFGVMGLVFALLSCLDNCTSSLRWREGVVVQGEVAIDAEAKAPSQMSPPSYKKAMEAAIDVEANAQSQISPSSHAKAAEEV